MGEDAVESQNCDYFKAFVYWAAGIKYLNEVGDRAVSYSAPDIWSLADVGLLESVCSPHLFTRPFLQRWWMELDLPRS